METKKSKVLACAFNQEFTYEGKTYYKYFINFANGDFGFCTVAVKADPFTVNEEVDYTIEPGKKAGEFKIRKVKAEGGGGKSPFSKPVKLKRDYMSEALFFDTSYVKDMVISGHVDIKDFIPLVQKLLEFSESKIKSYFEE
jgi:hypothetical protein